MKSTRTALTLILGLTALTGLAACEFDDKPRFTTGGQFWQRTHVSEALYMQGPKAQQMLHRDIARCVTEMREMEKLGALKEAIPTDEYGHVLTHYEMDEEYKMALADWDAPERDKELFAEHSNYTDFESCMDTKGWERVEHLPYDTAQKGRDNYIKATPEYLEEQRKKANRYETTGINQFEHYKYQ